MVTLYNSQYLTEGDDPVTAYLTSGPGTPGGDIAQPGPGVTADLDTLRRYIGAVSTQDDTLLQERLDAAQQYVFERVASEWWGEWQVQEAILMMASRLYSRRQSPDGTAGFGGEGIVIRVLATDPDIMRLLERYVGYGSGPQDVALG